jgi:hypothetical protein
MSLIPIYITNQLGNTNATANSVTMQCNPPIDLSKDEYYAGLVSCSINYCNPNIIQGQNSSFVYGTYSGGSLTNTVTINLSTGLYSLDEIQNFIGRQTLATNNNVLFIFQGDTATSQIYMSINQTTKDVNGNSLIYGVDLTNSTLLKKMLGFTQGGIVSGASPIESQLKANLNTLTDYVITCDFINGGYNTTSTGLNKSNILYTVTPDVASYSQIIRNVENVLYVRVNKNLLENITVNLLDQNLNQVDFTNGTFVNPESFTLLLYIVNKRYLFKS